MWIVKIALSRPYTFIVLALLILIISPVVILRTPTDIFPNINIPVIAVAWTYTGLNPEEMEGRLTTRLRARPDHHGRQHRAHRIDHRQRPGDRQDLPAADASLDTANAQVTAISQTMLRQLPPGTLPPLIINYSASSVPILQLGLSGKGLSEQQLNDLGAEFRAAPSWSPSRARSFPIRYGGKQRQVMIDLRPEPAAVEGLSPTDVLNAVTTQNLVLPSGTAKIGEFEYDVRLNAAPRTVEELNDLPIKVVGQLDDLSARRRQRQRRLRAADQHRPPGRPARRAGQHPEGRQRLHASTWSTASAHRLPRAARRCRPNSRSRRSPTSRSSSAPRSAASIREAVIAAALTALMILLFLGSWRSTLIIAISIPLSILTSVIVLGLLGETINIMTLGGLALAVGILVDDATVTIENIERHLEEGQRPARPRSSTAPRRSPCRRWSRRLCICIVFLPMFFLTGVARISSCRWPRRWSSRCWRPIFFRARWFRPWRCIC